MSKSDYYDDDGYERCVVTFFDILGFRALLKQRSASEIASMMSTFRTVSESDEPIEPVRRMKEARVISQPQVEWISDAIVRSRTVDVGNLLTFFIFKSRACGTVF